MAPSAHLDWFDDNLEWFAELTENLLEISVPNCPGWTVETVLTHLTFGLGVAYPYAARSEPDAADGFAGILWPSELPTGSSVLPAFGRHMRECSEVFRSLDPTYPCWTYAGPGTASFWFRRAAIETALHRMDVEDALNQRGDALTDERSFDAIAEAVEFALPLAATLTAATPTAITIRVHGAHDQLLLGDGRPSAEIVGAGESVLSALWGRRRDSVVVRGDQAAADAWMSLVSQVFAGR